MIDFGTLVVIVWNVMSVFFNIFELHFDFLFQVQMVLPLTR